MLYSKRALQLAVAVGGLVPIGAGLARLHLQIAAAAQGARDGGVA